MLVIITGYKCDKKIYIKIKNIFEEAIEEYALIGSLEVAKSTKIKS